jgi:hypothetical protein
MAYNTHYRIAYKRHSNSTTTIDILENNYGGGITNLVASSDPLNIMLSGDVDNIYIPTVGSGATLNVTALPLTLQNLFTDDPQKFMIKVYNGNSGTNLMWQGFINTGVYTESYSVSANKPSEISIQCNDGMNVLDRLYYRMSDTSVYTGTATIGTVLTNILGKIGLTFTNIYTSNDITTDGAQTNLFTQLIVNNQNYIDENIIPMSCREVLNSIFGGLGLVMSFKGSNIYIIDPINLHDTTKGKVYDVATFTENSSTLGGYLDISTNDIRWYQTGSQLDIVDKKDEIDIKYDPYTFLGYSYDFSDVKNLLSVGSWGHITTPSEWYNNPNPVYKNWTQSTGGHFVAAKETPTSDPTYMLWLTNTDINNQPVLTLSLPNISLYKDSNLFVKISLDSWFQTRENNYNIFAPGTGNQVYGYYVQTSLRIGNQYYNGSAWTTTFTHNIIAVKSCTSPEFYDNPANSTANDTWITASTILPLDNTLVGSEVVEFCIYDYWSGSQGTTQRKNFSPVIGILLKNINISIVDINGKEITNTGILQRGNISTNLMYKSSPLEIATTNGSGKYGVSRGSFRYINNVPVSTLYRSGAYSTEQLVLQSMVSQYKQPRFKISGCLDAKNYLLNLNMKLIKDSNYQGSKAFYIVNGTYNDRYENMSVDMLELTSTRDALI